MQRLIALFVAVVPLFGAAALFLGLTALAPPMMKEAGQAPEAFGWLAGAFGLGSLWFSASNHTITPAFGPVRTLQVGLVVAACGALLITSGHWPVMLAGGVIVGLGYASTTPAGSQILADYTPQSQWSTLFSIRQAAVPIGGVTAGLVAAALVTPYGWRVALAAMAVFAIACAAALSIVPRAYNEKRARQPFSIARVFAPGNWLRPFSTLREIPNLARLTAVGVAFAVTFGATATFLVTFFNTGLGLSLVTAQLLFTVFQAAGLGGRIVFGFLADVIGSRRRVMRMLAVCAALSMMVLAIMTPAWPLAVIYALAAITGLAVATWNGLYLAEIALIGGRDNVSEATAAAGFFNFAAYSLAPPVFGTIASYSNYRVAFFVAAASAILASLLLVNLERDGGET
jgi:MFS family permease